jgi:hypothetical protein
MTANQWKLLDLLERHGGQGTIEVELQFGEYAPHADENSGFRTTRLVVASLMRSLVSRGLATNDENGYDITDHGREVLKRHEARLQKAKVATPAPAE